MSDQCCRCGELKGTLLHLWWSCPIIKSFWLAIFKFRHLVIGKKWPETPEVALLSLILGSIKSIKKGRFRFLLMAIPTIWEWVVEMNYTKWMEELVCTVNKNDLKFREVWTLWVEFLESPQFLSCFKIVKTLSVYAILIFFFLVHCVYLLIIRKAVIDSKCIVAIPSLLNAKGHEGIL